MQAGEANIIKKRGGKEDTKRCLESLGFVIGGCVTIVSEMGKLNRKHKGCESGHWKRYGK